MKSNGMVIFRGFINGSLEKNNNNSHVEFISAPHLKGIRSDKSATSKSQTKQAGVLK